jgi:hypothetical protein
VAPAEASIVYPTSKVVATRVSEVLETVNDGAEGATRRVNVAEALPLAFVAVIVYVVAP